MISTAVFPCGNELELELDGIVYIDQSNFAASGYDELGHAGLSMSGSAHSPLEFSADQ